MDTLPRETKMSKQGTEDRHASSWMIRLPESLKPVVLQLVKKNDRPMTVEIQRAILAYAKAEGLKTNVEPEVQGHIKRKGKK